MPSLNPSRFRQCVATGLGAGALLACACGIPSLLAWSSAQETRELDRASTAVGTLVGAVEQGYAAGTLSIDDDHLKLPAIHTHCTRISLLMPATGRARISCTLRYANNGHSTLQLHRSPAGVWRCQAQVRYPERLPDSCVE